VLSRWATWPKSSVLPCVSNSLNSVQLTGVHERPARLDEPVDGRDLGRLTGVLDQQSAGHDQIAQPLVGGRRAGLERDGLEEPLDGSGVVVE